MEFIKLKARGAEGQRLRNEARGPRPNATHTPVPSCCPQVLPQNPKCSLKTVKTFAPMYWPSLSFPKKIFMSVCFTDSPQCFRVHRLWFGPFPCLLSKVKNPTFFKSILPVLPSIFLIIVMIEKK